MSSNCNCNNNTRRNAIIRDNTQTDGSICILADQVFDGVKEILNASECIVTILDPPGTVTELLSAVSSDAAAQCDHITVDPDCQRFSLVSCTLTSLGNCTYRLSNNDIITGRCLRLYALYWTFPPFSAAYATVSTLYLLQAPFRYTYRPQDVLLRQIFLPAKANAALPFRKFSRKEITALRYNPLARRIAESPFNATCGLSLFSNTKFAYSS